MLAWKQQHGGQLASSDVFPFDAFEVITKSATKSSRRNQIGKSAKGCGGNEPRLVQRDLEERGIDLKWAGFLPWLINEGVIEYCMLDGSFL